MASPEDESHALSFAEKIGTDVVTFEVGLGDSKRTFTIHKDILCKKAPHFDKLFNGPFLEGSTQVAVLDEEDPEAFVLFVSWVYIDQIQISAAARGSHYIKLLSNLFCFAEKYGIFALADMTMDSLIAGCNERGILPSTDHMHSGYSKTSAKSKLRLFLARIYVYITLRYTEEEASHAWPKDEMQRVVVENEDLWFDTFALLRAQSGKEIEDPRKTAACDYHCHAADTICPYLTKGSESSPGTAKSTSRKHKRKR